MKTLGIVAALPVEARILLKRPVPAGDLIQPSDTTLVHICGIGAERAQIAARALVEKGVNALLSWGFAGGLDLTLLPGHLVLPERVISPDRSRLEVDAFWHERLCRLLAGQLTYHTEPLAQSPKILSNQEEKRSFFEHYGAVAVDMESASVAQVALLAKLPFMAIRAVVDPFDMAIPKSSLAAIDECGRVRFLQLLGGLARKPTELFPLLQLGSNFRIARTTLATVARLTRHNLLLL